MKIMFSEWAAIMICNINIMTSSVGGQYEPGPELIGYLSGHDNPILPAWLPAVSHNQSIQSINRSSSTAHHLQTELIYVIARKGYSFFHISMCVICQPGGPYWEKLCMRSWVRLENAGWGPCSIPRAQFFSIRTDLGQQIMENHFRNICVDLLLKQFHTVCVRFMFQSSKLMLLTEVFKRRESVSFRWF